MRRIIMLLTVAALMAAMVVASAMPVFAQAVVTPKTCQPAGSATEVCRHNVVTPSGNRSSHTTVATDTPTGTSRTHTVSHFHPDNLP